MRACTGKPLELGGIPHELGTTGYGVTSALESAIEVLEELKLLHISKKQNRVSI
jgi:glutamate dehydrogenase (NAD(P)+)